MSRDIPPARPGSAASNAASPDPTIAYSRRAALGMLAGGAALLPGAGRAATPGSIRAIAFDGFPIFDPRSVTARVVALVPERGRDLAQSWSTKLFGNSWLYTSAGQYAPFDEVADNALRYAAESLGVSLTASDRAGLVDAYAALDVWPDVKPALTRLREAGVKLAFLSNLGEQTLRSNMRRNDLDAAFDHVLSSDRVRAFKPSPKAYAMAIDAFGLPKSRIGFAAFGGWDAAGAAWFGYRTAWVNRLGVPLERLGPGPSFVSRTMSAVLDLAAVA